MSVCKLVCVCLLVTEGMVRGMMRRREEERREGGKDVVQRRERERGGGITEVGGKASSFLRTAFPSFNAVTACYWLWHVKYFIFYVLHSHS